MPHKTLPEPDFKIPVGISACLLGDNVRFNGGHSQSQLCLKVLDRYFDYVRFCPEVAAGFPTPRPTMRLTGDPEQPVLRYSNDDQSDLTETLTQGFEKKVANCDHLDGYILMKNSPSCGLERIKIYQPNGHPHNQRGRGLFTEALMERYPLMPVEEEGRLHDDHLFENFIMRVYAHYHFRTEVRENPSYHNLIQFHSSYKYLLMAHHQATYKSLGKKLATSADLPLEPLIEEYQAEFTEAISKPAKRGGHANVLLHILGYLKKTVSGEERQNIVDIIEQYQRGDINLATPVTLLHHYIKLHGSDYIRAQRYLEPYPAALGLRNTI
jgi:uncharacterized protein YbgA (DUF1722 family)/uncharacterized protein YbbK (DUF523 family)